MSKKLRINADAAALLQQLEGATIKRVVPIQLYDDFPVAWLDIVMETPDGDACTLSVHAANDTSYVRQGYDSAGECRQYTVTMIPC